MRMFYVLVVVLAITFAVICACEPVRADGWEQYRAHLDLFAYAKRCYLHGNPRWGQLVLASMFRCRAIAICVTPLVIVATLFASMTLIRGRLPRARDPDDARLLVQVLATALLTTPAFGTIWFHRPNAANYLYPLLVQLVWLIPYRFLSLRRLDPAWWHALAIVPLGAFAGAGNEHTGIGLAIAGVACMSIAWRRDRQLPAWSILGVLALVAGYIALLAAPGQLERYNQLAMQHSALGRIAARGWAGNLRVVAAWLAWLAPMIALVAWIGGRSWRGRWLPRVSRRAIAACLAVAVVIVVTALAAPRVPARLLVAPSALVAIALGLFLVELATHAGKSRRLHLASIAISTSVLAVTLTIFVVTGLEGRARMRTLAAAPRGAIVCLRPYTFAKPTVFSVGDDLQNPTLAARVARIFGVGKVQLECEP